MKKLKELVVFWTAIKVEGEGSLPSSIIKAIDLTTAYLEELITLKEKGG